MVMKSPFDDRVSEANAVPVRSLAVAPTYGLTAGYRNVAMAVPEPSLRRDVCSGQAISTMGDHHDARRGSDRRWAVGRECRSRPVHRDIGRKAGDGLYDVAGGNDGQG
jgi:hypothetical protein